MFIQVRAQNPLHKGRSRAKRFFPNGATIRMEVVDQAEDFISKNEAGDLVGDMTRINRAGFEAIKADPYFSVLADGETSGGVSQELLDATKAKLADAVGKLSGTQVEIERLEGEVKAQAKTIAELRAALAGGKEAEPEAKVETDKGKAKGDKGK